MSNSRVPADRRPEPAQYVLVFLLGWFAWMMLAGRLSIEELVCGAAVSLLVTALSGHHLAVLSGLRLEPMALVHLFRFLPVFLRIADTGKYRYGAATWSVART
jgi:multisubunit Na+/H+ antiporter MnhE subunit